MRSEVGGRDVPADVRAVRDLVDTVALTGPASAAEQALLDFVESHLALVSRLDHDGTAGWKYQSVYELVAACGRWYIPAALPAGIRGLPERQCFANAAATEREHPHLAYTEGFAVAANSPLPTAHAWCTNADGHVIDPTWSDHEGGAYLGIALPTHLRPRAPHNWGVLEAPDSLYTLLRNGL
ncbi:hypothetical protein [Streptomyces tendae]|uniref:hypothetical protein n=1 Tax=Streptomyces tendae TaxID=1932 RepID=UPI003D72415B